MKGSWDRVSVNRFMYDAGGENGLSKINASRKSISLRAADEREVG
jgi:hypothetical protein